MPSNNYTKSPRILVSEDISFSTSSLLLPVHLSPPNCILRLNQRGMGMQGYVRQKMQDRIDF